MVFICGPHCIPGKTARSILVGRFSIVSSGALRGLETVHLLRMIAPLGQRNDLCVVVIIAWNPQSNGFFRSPAAINHPICEISA
jgi:hypothetical protein